MRAAFTQSHSTPFCTSNYRPATPTGLFHRRFSTEDNQQHRPFWSVNNSAPAPASHQTMGDQFDFDWNIPGPPNWLGDAEWMLQPIPAEW